MSWFLNVILHQRKGQWLLGEMTGSRLGQRKYKMAFSLEQYLMLERKDVLKRIKETHQKDKEASLKKLPLTKSGTI